MKINKTLIITILFIFAAYCNLSKCNADSYNNNDISTLKTKQKNLPNSMLQNESVSTKTYLNTDVNSLKSNDLKKGYDRTGSEKTKMLKKDTPGSVNYKSPEGNIKIEIKNNNISTKNEPYDKKSKDNGHSYPKFSGAKSKEKKNNDNISLFITEIPITMKILPYEVWKEEYEEYFLSHYNEASNILTPKAIVISSTYIKSTDTLWNIFKQGSLYSEGDDGAIYGHLSCHFIIDKSGEIIQTMPLNQRTRGAYGINHIALTIELIGANNTELINNGYQKKSLYRLISLLMSKYKIPLNKVYGHHEVAKGKTVVPEYTEYNDNDYPESYPPEKMCYDPGSQYINELKIFFSKQTSKGQ